MLNEKIIEKYINENLNIEIDESTVKNILNLRLDKNSFDFISKETNIRKHIIGLICRKYGVSNSYNSGSFKSLTTDDIEYIKKVYAETKNIRKTANITNFGKDTVSKYINGVSKSKEKGVVAVTKWRLNKRLELIKYKGGKCQICGYDKCFAALEFHHLDPKEKDFTISGKSWAFEKLKKEVDKCILVCSNCHKEIHFKMKKQINEVVVVKKVKEKTLKIKEIKEKPKCKICDNKCKTSASVYCSNECFDIGRAENIPTKTDFVFKLKELHNFVQIGKYYNVSDNSIRKWCKKYDIPTTKTELKEYLKKE